MTSTTGRDDTQLRQAIRKTLKFHKLTEHGDCVVEADLADAVMKVLAERAPKPFDPVEEETLSWREGGGLITPVEAARLAELRAMLTPPIIVKPGPLSPEAAAELKALMANYTPGKMVLVAAPDTGYVRIRKLWDRNSGFAQYQWLYYVDLVNAHGESACTVNVSCHAGEMNEYGTTEGRARERAEKIAAFFGWPIRVFEEERTTTVILKEK